MTKASQRTLVTLHTHHSSILRFLKLLEKGVRVWYNKWHNKRSFLGGDMKLTKHRKCQIILACCIPILGFFFVIFNSFFYLRKNYCCKYMQQVLFYIFCLPPVVIGFLIMGLLYRYVIYPFSSSVTALLTITLIVWFVIFVGVAFTIIGMEKLYIRKFFKDIPDNQNEINLL